MHPEHLQVVNSRDEVERRHLVTSGTFAVERHQGMHLNEDNLVRFRLGLEETGKMGIYSLSKLPSLKGSAPTPASWTGKPEVPSCSVISAGREKHC